MDKIRITECLDIDLEKEQWCCNRCGHELYAARDNYKKGCLVAERDMKEVHPPMTDDATYSFMPDPDYCRLVEFYCPSCGTMLENEYLPPGHPLTHEIELDIDALKAKYANER
ncbi:acetone carboxylase subunit gamma [Emcibacter nanhaiensis]|uniref:Acetophenone carboxylase n=1 Tax=Emcibacter nanhaiensis TaxID=1505037 RepID=A0A501PJM8_9PROT|nr:acetone carboxylase subunit gamma [Emcibacter nanhaiensis]TPD60669.1 acetophenone carboxylase [Emcibacter nanhaiensis]